MAGMPSDSELEIAARELLLTVNVEEASLKIIRQRLEALFKVDLSEKKAFLKEKVTAIMLEGEEEEEEEEGEEEDEDDEEEEEEEEEEPAAKKPKPRKRTEFQLSPALYEFMGSKETMMARGDVTKAVWAYIREASLQDPKDGRKIRNDEKMFRVFKCKTMNMMHIAKKLSPHLKKYSDLVVGDDETAGSSSGVENVQGGAGQRGAGSKKRSAAGSSTTTKAKKAKAGGTPKGRPKAGGGGVAAKKGGKGKNGAAGGKGDEKVAKKTRKPSSVMWRVSDELAAVVGSNEGTVDTIRAGVYGYIKEHNLQDPQKRTMVICDPTLERVMGQKVVKMFGMQSLISPHRLHKL